MKSIIPHGQGEVVIISDHQERTPDGIYIAEGDVDITYLNMRLQADHVTYNSVTHDSTATGNCIFTQGDQFFHASHGEYNFETQAGKFYNVDGYTDKEFLIRGYEIDKKSEEKYAVERGFLTACREASPLWSFTSSKTNIKVNKHATLYNAFFRVKNVPLFYFPLIVVPLEKRERQMGFLVPSVGSSTTKGKFLHAGFYAPVGPSADAFFLADYFSKRGNGYGFRFRARPSERARLNALTYFVRDRLGASGGDIIVNGETRLPYGFRAMANINYVTNFKFRQVFADTFRTATNTVENSSVFVSKYFDAYSTRFFFSRQATFFPDHSVVIHNGPSFDFRSAGKKVGSLGPHPLYLYLDSSVENLNRLDRFNSTDLGRFDLFPRVSVPLHSISGISLTPTIGFRETYYTNSLMPGNLAQTSGQALNRRYVLFELAARGPGFYKVFREHTDRRKFKHLIQPEVTYRKLSGVQGFDRFLRFDERDVIFDTNEVEYALVNRIFVKREQIGSTNLGNHEYLSVKLSQKYFFDPTFGHILTPGRVNTILPITTLSGFTFFADGRRHTSPINVQFKLNPSFNYNFEMRADYDSRYKRWRDTSLNGSLLVNKFFLSTTYLVTKQIIGEPTTFKSNQFQSQIAVGNPTRGFAAGLILSYDIQRNLLLYSGTRLHYATDCCGTTLEIRQFNLGFRNETQFRFTFILKGIGHFGNVRNPESLF